MATAAKKRSGQASKQVSHDQEMVDPALLNFDTQNPRFYGLSLKSEEAIVRELYEQADVNELIQSILSSGYLDFEPLIVQRKGNIVLEGNRRLAALRLIASADLRNSLKVTLPDLPNARPAPTEVRVLWVDNRDDARSFIGFKHINGAFKWDALAKANYAAHWFESGADIDEIARSLGDNHNTVRRLVNGFYALKQALEDGFDIHDISGKKFAFSHLYTALTRVSVREFLGLADEDIAAPPKRNPVPKGKRDQFAQLMSWLYGQESKGQPTLIRNQNPNLNELSKVLGNPVAKRMLMANRDLRVAYQQVDPPSARFEEALLKASKQCEETLSLAGSFTGEPTLMRIADGMQRTVRSLVSAMKEALDVKSSDS